MKEIIDNKYSLSEKDVTEVVVRVKVLLVNSKKEILLAYSHNNYQFPGGHVEDNEELIDTVKREVREETGIILENVSEKPFALFKGYYKDWPSEGKNRKIEIYFYEIKTNEKYNLNNTEYTENEKSGNFELRYIPLDKVEDELKNNIKEYGDTKGICREMLDVFKIYKSIKK